MRIVQDLYEDFNMKYANFPTPFEDLITGDGIVTSFQITFYPLSEIYGQNPQVWVNDGTFAVPNWVLKTKDVDYRIDHVNGKLDFIITPPPAHVDGSGDPVPTCKVSANHVKCNLKQFLSFFNSLTGAFTLLWPRRAYEQITSAML